jgi:hypothetical protein
MALDINEKCKAERKTGDLKTSDLSKKLQLSVNR